MSRLYFAIALSITLHAVILLVRCEPTVPDRVLDETLVELQSEEPAPVVEAPQKSPPPPPPPPPPVATPPQETPPEAPAETVTPVDSTPPPMETPPPTPVVSASSDPSAKPSSNPLATQGHSEGHPVGAETLDNKNFKPFGNQKPNYPEMARRMGIEGSATLRILVNEKGQVEQIEVTQWKGHPSFGQAATATARAWRFAPPRYRGQPTKAWFTRTIAFQLR